MYEQMTFERVLQRMLSAVPANVDKREGSILYDALCGAALEMANLYLELDVILNETFADTASREFLIRRAAERGLNVPDMGKGDTLTVAVAIITVYLKL